MRERTGPTAPFSERTGKKDTRGAYGLHAREMIRWLVVPVCYGPLVELHRDWAVIELAANGSRHVFERRRVDAGDVTLPWIERGRRPGDV